MNLGNNSTRNRALHTAAGTALGRPVAAGFRWMGVRGGALHSKRHAENPSIQAKSLDMAEGVDG
jgi:hypothetical protein